MVAHLEAHGLRGECPLVNAERLRRGDHKLTKSGKSRIAGSASIATGDDIAKALGKKERGHTVAGMMGALGRRLKHRHRGRWPFSAKWNALASRWEYVMPAATGALLSKIIKAGS